MKSKILIATYISILAVVLTGCPSTPVVDKAAAKEQAKQQMLKRSDQQFKDMEQQMNNNN